MIESNLKFPTILLIYDAYGLRFDSDYTGDVDKEQIKAIWHPLQCIIHLFVLFNMFKNVLFYRITSD